MSSDKVFLIGFMGCGKSTLGRHLAQALGWDFIDLDNYFENKFKTTVSLFFAEFGEDGFRDAERSALYDLKSKTKAVVATGGGAPCFFDNIDFMNEHGVTIYMKTSPEVLAQRLSNSRNVRPLVKGKSGDELIRFIKEKLNSRETYYNKAQVIADAEVTDLNGYLRVLDGAGIEGR